MKKNKTITIGILIVLVVALLGGAGYVLLMNFGDGNSENESVSNNNPNQDIRMFAEWTDIEEFQNIPAMYTAESYIGKPVDFGDNNYVIDVNGTKKEDYEAYVSLLQEAGFTKHSDNGEDGMEGYVYTSNFSKENVTVVVSYAVNSEKTYISACFDEQLSDYMIKDESSMQGVSADAKTSLHMMQLNDNGNSFIIQLKNGHFVIEDGGQSYDAPYLLDYLESLVPEGEKPVIEAWFISHPHTDHYGALDEIISDKKYTNRIYVEGIYYTAPSKKLLAQVGEPENNSNWTITKAWSALTSQDGGKPGNYRMHLGQRFYFCDIMIDVPMTMEQLPFESYYGDVNDTSTWLTHHIEGQRFIHGGDAFHTSIREMMYMYDEDYMDVEVFAVLHHGINVYDYFTDFCSIDTLLYTSFRTASIWEPSRKDLSQVKENEYLKTTVAESISHGEGTVVLTFPYKVGEAKILDPCDWRYNHGKPKRRVWEG